VPGSQYDPDDDPEARAVIAKAMNVDKKLRLALEQLDKDADEIGRLRALNAELVAALEKIVDLAHYPDESIARAAIAKATAGR
jgi:hypothetical protein